MGHRQTGVQHQIVQKIKFGRCQANRGGILAYEPALGIKLDIADSNG
jgi:hypothetical protein